MNLLPRRARNERGQLLAIVIALMVIVGTLVPVMLYYAQRENVWTAKQAASTDAFHMAEAGVEKAYLSLSLTTQTWVNLQAGITPANYRFDRSFVDVGSGGSYAISITSGPAKQQATIISVGRDRHNKEVRALKVVYANAALGDVAIRANGGVTMTGSNVEVEWGAIVSPNAITIENKLHPSFYSASSIDKDTNGTTPPNCDSPNCYWWHSYYTGIPPTPPLDFAGYKSSAIASGVSPCGLSYYQSGNVSGDCNDTTGKTFYVEGNWTTFKGSIVGNVIIMGNLTWHNGSINTTAVTATLPTEAWKQYCNDWATYKANYDPGTPYSACPINSSYAPTLTKAIAPSIKGLLYVGGNFTIPNGGGNDDLVYGMVIVQGTADVNTNSHSKIYYDANISSGLQTTQIVLSRVSWQGYLVRWPTGL